GHYRRRDDGYRHGSAVGWSVPRARGTRDAAVRRLTISGMGIGFPCRRSTPGTRTTARRPGNRRPDTCRTRRLVGGMGRRNHHGMAPQAECRLGSPRSTGTARRRRSHNHRPAAFRAVCRLPARCSAHPRGHAARHPAHSDGDGRMALAPCRIGSRAYDDGWHSGGGRSLEAVSCRAALALAVHERLAGGLRDTPGFMSPITETPGAGPSVSGSGGEIPLGTKLSMFLRLLAVQASWNYEILLGNGIGFCVEPALRRLPGGSKGLEYREALARQSNYFNAHPYLASVAVGALARAELDGEAALRIERFRTALCGPLGSVGDRLVWAAWLPLCS